MASRHCAILAGILTAALFSAPALSDPHDSWTQDKWSECKNDAPIVEWEVQIESCTALIGTGRYEGDELADAYYLRAAGYHYIYDHESALKDLNRTIALRPTYHFARQDRCWAYAALGRLSEALAECDAAISVQPDPRYPDPTAYSNRGFANLRLGRLEAALADYEMSINIQSHNGPALYGRGLVKLRMGDTNGGRADVAAGMAIQPTIVDDYERIK